MKADLADIQKRHPGMEIIVGYRTANDKGVRVNMPEMELDRNTSINAATEYLFGDRVSAVEKRPMGFPTALFTFILGTMAASGVWLLVL